MYDTYAPHLHPPGPEVPRGARRLRRDRRRRQPGVPRAGRFGRGRDRVLDRLGLRRQRRDGRGGGAGDARAPRPARPWPGSIRRPRRPSRKWSAFLKVAPAQCIKTIIVRGNEGLVALCVRGDHEVNEVKAAKLAELPGESVLAGEAEILAAIGCRPGFIGPAGLPASIPVIVDRSAAVVADFVCGGNAEGTHCTGANWERDARVTRVADIRKVVEGDPGARRQRHPRHRARHRGGPCVPARAEVRRVHAGHRARRTGQGAGDVHGLLRRRRQPHRGLRDRAEPRRLRHRLAGRDGALARRGVRDQSQGRSPGSPKWPIRSMPN